MIYTIEIKNRVVPARAGVILRELEKEVKETGCTRTSGGDPE
jgi:hypothetical protein